MQVEGSKKPSNGRLTTSLIAPITMASPPKSTHPTRNVPPRIIGVHPPSTSDIIAPKFVLLGSQQDAQGAVSYRIGISFPLSTKINVRELSKSLSSTLANGQIPLHHNNEHVHAYVSTTDSRGNKFQTHLVIEDQKDGLVAADIAAVSGDQTSGVLRGFISKTTESSGIEFEPGKPFIATLNDSDSLPRLVDLGTVDRFELEVGTIDRASQDFIIKRIGTELKIFSRDAGVELETPFADQPIATLQQSSLASRFPGSLASIRLSSEIAAGNVFANARTSLIESAFDPRNSSSSGRSL